MGNPLRSLFAAGLAVSAACGAKSGAPATGPDEIDNAGAAGGSDAVVPCPAELASWLRGSWQLPPEQRIEITCAPGLFPAPGWAISAVVDESEDDAYARSLVLAAADRTTIAEGSKDPVAPWYRAEGGGLVTFETLDFDGDGKDELVHSETVHHGGTYGGTYQVVGVVGDKLVTLLTVTIAEGNDAGGAEDPADERACSAEVVVGEPAKDGVRELIVTGTVEKGDPADSECIVGRTVYTLSGGAFRHD